VFYIFQARTAQRWALRRDRVNSSLKADEAGLNTDAEAEADPPAGAGRLNTDAEGLHGDVAGLNAEIQSLGLRLKV